ncbi:putative RNA-directed DNA polymerase from transposon BS [Trichonephila clavipes]|uniref:Putative RNA-directed DNA polymerase from transposon BS n=1 Tax=Trichonephila clavipes TaxID=2585209 RepID=A0A8X6WB46_TRICX|nr:putative RNA-directed DNA polymerase from transposon BS [Trichonephila clavipes]
MHESLKKKLSCLVLNALDPKKSPGPDNMHGVRITHLGPRGTQRLLDIFNQSCKSGRLPHEWKRATIIPIRKSGKVLSSPESYRSVALTSIPCKIMERMMLRRLINFLDSNNLLPREQYRFRRGHRRSDFVLLPMCQRWPKFKTDQSYSSRIFRLISFLYGLEKQIHSKHV